MAKKKIFERGPRSKQNETHGSARESIEAIYRQWQTERPDIDPEPVLIYGLISRIQSDITACIDEVLAPYQLVRGTFDVLTALRRAGSPYCLSPKKLTEHLVLSGAGLNGRLNILERLTYIARLPEPTDRRTLRIRLTTSGQRVVNKLTPRLFQLQWEILSEFGSQDRKAFADYLAKMAEAIVRRGHS
jgi:DNA-binding MarR family transcriptional regulator